MSRDPWAFQRWAFETTTGNIGRKAVLVALAVMADKATGRCEALQETIARQVEAEERTVRRHLRDLEQARVIARRHQYRLDGKRRGDQFLLLAPWVTEWPDGHPLPANLAGSSPPTTGQNPQDLPANIDSDYRPESAGQEQATSRNDHSVKDPPSPLRAEFEAWLEHHAEVTGSKVMTRAGTRARAAVEKMYRAARKEYPDEDLRLVSLGAVADEYRREKGYTDPESVLRPKAIPKLLERGRESQPAVTPIDFRRGGRRAPTLDRAWLADHPRSEDLDEQWAPIADELRKSVDDSTFAIWLAQLHPHDIGETVVLGAPPQSVTWVAHRFGRLLEAAAQRPVSLVNCGCPTSTPPAPSDSLTTPYERPSQAIQQEAQP